MLLIRSSSEACRLGTKFSEVTWKTPGLDEEGSFGGGGEVESRKEGSRKCSEVM